MSSTIDIAATATDRPPVLDDRALFGHPRGLGLLFATEMWERFSYYGMRALLVLYLTAPLVSQDGKHLLRAVDDSGRRGMADLPEIQALRREWQLQFTGEQGSLALIVSCTQSCRL